MVRTLSTTDAPVKRCSRAGLCCASLYTRFYHSDCVKSPDSVLAIVLIHR